MLGPLIRRRRAGQIEVIASPLLLDDPDLAWDAPTIHREEDQGSGLFVDREGEIGVLRECLLSPPQLVVLTGRLRVGTACRCKTEFSVVRTRS